MELLNKSNKHFNFPFGQHKPNEKKEYEDKRAELILKSYPNHFEIVEQMEEKKTDKKPGGNKKCRK